MILRERAATWIAERAYYLWLDDGCRHGHDKEHHEKAEREWLKLMAKSWRSWNRDARYDLIIDLNSQDEDVESRVKEVVMFFFTHKSDNEGFVHHIGIRNNFMMVWLTKPQPHPGYHHDWRICDLPRGWNRPVTEPRELVLKFQRYTV